MSADNEDGSAPPSSQPAPPPLEVIRLKRDLSMRQNEVASLQRANEELTSRVSGRATPRYAVQDDAFQKLAEELAHTRHMLKAEETTRRLLERERDAWDERTRNGGGADAGREEDVDDEHLLNLLQEASEARQQAEMECAQAQEALAREREVVVEVTTTFQSLLEQEREQRALMEEEVRALHGAIAELQTNTASALAERDQTKQEIEELTQALFEEANELVAAEARRRHEAQHERERLADQLRMAKMKLGSLQLDRGAQAAKRAVRRAGSARPPRPLQRSESSGEFFTPRASPTVSGRGRRGKVGSGFEGALRGTRSASVAYPSSPMAGHDEGKAAAAARSLAGGVGVGGSRGARRSMRRMTTTEFDASGVEGANDGDDGSGGGDDDDVDGGETSGTEDTPSIDSSSPSSMRSSLGSLGDEFPALLAPLAATLLGVREAGPAAPGFARFLDGRGPSAVIAAVLTEARLDTGESPAAFEGRRQRASLVSSRQARNRLVDAAKGGRLSLSTDDPVAVGGAPVIDCALCGRCRQAEGVVEGPGIPMQPVCRLCSLRVSAAANLGDFLHVADPSRDDNAFPRALVMALIAHACLEAYC